MWGALWGSCSVGKHEGCVDHEVWGSMRGFGCHVVSGSMRGVGIIRGVWIM